mgnify:CR=1 FL=1
MDLALFNVFGEDASWVILTYHLIHCLQFGLDGMLEPDKLADTVMETLESERFLCLPHPEVLTYMRRKTDDYDRWLGGMRRLQGQFEEVYKKREDSQDD